MARSRTYGAPLLRPLDPLFDEKKRMGAIQVGNTGVGALTVTISQTSEQVDPANGGCVTFSVVFSLPVDGLSASQFIIGGTAVRLNIPQSLSLASVTASTYELTVRWFTTAGTVTASLPAGVVSATGNPSILNEASTSVDGTVTWSPWSSPVGGGAHLWDLGNPSTLSLTDLGGGIFIVTQVNNQIAAQNMISNVAGQRPIANQELTCQLGANWDGTDDWMQAASVAIDGDQTIFFVGDIFSTTQKVLLEHSADWNTNNGQIITPVNSGEIRYGIRRTGGASNVGATVTTTGLHVWTFRADGTHANQAIRRDGINLTVSTVAGLNADVGTATVTDALNWGARNKTSLQIAADMGLVYICNTTLSDGDCETVEDSLIAAYGIAA